MPYTGYACNDFCSEQFLEFLAQHLEPNRYLRYFDNTNAPQMSHARLWEGNYD